MTGPARWADIAVLGRLSFPWVADASFGGLQGIADYIFAAVVMAWTVTAVTQHRKNLFDAADRELLLAAAMFFTVALVLPDAYMTTILFSKRWVPPAMILLVLAVPAVSWAPIVRHVAALVLLALLCSITAGTWMLFQRQELTGLREALAAIPPRSRVLGLDMVMKSDLIKGRPFLQVFAYSQILRDTSLNFSFAEYPSNPVVYKKRFQSAWTPGLEWLPWRAKASDLDYFDYVLIHWNRSLTWVLNDPRLISVTRKGDWRLYSVGPYSGGEDDLSRRERASRLLFDLSTPEYSRAQEPEWKPLPW